MSRSKKHRSKKAGLPPPRGSSDSPGGRGKTSAHDRFRGITGRGGPLVRRDSDGQQPKRASAPWLYTKGPVLRFVIGFGLLIILFYACYVPFTNTPAFRSYVTFLAKVSGPVLRVMGQDVTVSGSSLRSPECAITVDVGCDGFEPAGVFVSAVLAFPATIASRLLVALVGSLCLVLLNIIRIVSLFCFGAYSPRVMDRMHEDVWPTVLIFVALVGWVVWARKAVRFTDENANVSV